MKLDDVRTISFWILLVFIGLLVGVIAEWLSAGHWMLVEIAYGATLLLAIFCYILENIHESEEVPPPP